MVMHLVYRFQLDLNPLILINLFFILVLPVYLLSFSAISLFSDALFFFYSFFGIPGFRFCCFSIPLGTGRLLGWFCVGGFFRGSCYWRWSWCFTGRPQMPDEDLIELKFRLYDGSDIGPFRYSPTSTIAMVKERIVAEWPKGQWIGSCY